MNKKLLITRPEHDDTTHYLSHWSKKATDICLKRGISVLDLHRERANKKEFISMLSKQNPQLVVFNGHGREDAVTGHKKEALVVAGENEGVLKEKITYSISCKSAAILGQKSIESGAKAYLGYKDDFIFLYDPDKITYPLADETAKLFLEPSNELIVSLIKGNPVEEAWNRSQQYFRTNITKLLSSEAKPEETAMVRYIWWDMINQVCLGDKEARF